MKNLTRIIIALAIFLSGAALIPFVELPSEGINWQKYAGVYVPLTLEIDHTSGRPGSLFALTGRNFPTGETALISANGVALGSASIDASGELRFLIDTTGADQGTYFVTAQAGETAGTSFFLYNEAPLWVTEDEGPLFVLPPGVAMAVRYLPDVRFNASGP